MMSVGISNDPYHQRVVCAKTRGNSRFLQYSNCHKIPEKSKSFFKVFLNCHCAVITRSINYSIPLGIISSGHLLLLAIGMSLISQNASFAQVVNDNITNRSLLVLDSVSIQSSTNEATVEWNCINKALTNKCLIYHNDQWFTFSVRRQGIYYLNLSSQNCRDAKGIQAIVIEGNPCEVTNYKILHCIPRISQQDVFIELENVLPNKRYLVNIDGFLGDYCNFNIQLSSNPAGLGHLARNLDTLNLSSSTDQNIVTLHWTLPQTYKDNIDAFEIYRCAKGSPRFEMIGNLSPEFNTLGTAQSSYAFIDTLTSESTYTYEVVGLLNSGIKEILDQDTVNFYRRNNKLSQTLDVSLDFREGTDVRILLMDKNEDRILRQSAFAFRKVQDHNQRIYVGNYIEMGIRSFLVRIVSGKAYNVTDYEFVVLEDGSITRR